MSGQKIVCQHCGKILEQYEACGIGENGELYYLCERCCFGPAADIADNDGEEEKEAANA